jgi:threonine aldolase
MEEKEMIYFSSDYTEGAHPKVLKKLVDTNLEQTSGYGTDDYCKRAADKIKEACACPDADVHFLVGGTQTNLTVISASLRPHQGVICANTGHINVHETGAIEATGHKVISIPSGNGKLTADQIRDVVMEHRNEDGCEHAVQPKMAYISNPTEIGTIYSREELEEISLTCREFGIIL